MMEHTPVQRAFRDVHGVANHGANNWDLQAVAYAREVLERDLARDRSESAHLSYARLRAAGRARSKARIALLMDTAPDSAGVYSAGVDGFA
jgi:hypothetical protein